MIDVRKWFLQSYLKTIQYGHLTLIILLGLWPCYYDHTTKSYKTTWYLRFYSLTILASIIALLINTSRTLIGDISKTHPSDTGNIFGITLTSGVVLAVVMIYLIQIKKVEQINAVIEDGKTLSEQICSRSIRTSIDWSDFLWKFTFFIMFNGSLMCHLTISRLAFLSPQAGADFSLIFFYSIPNFILCVLVSVFFCGLSIFEKLFGVLNEQLAAIANDTIFDPFHVETHRGRRMNRFCILSDRIDQISSLHFKLSKLTRDFCDALAMQFMVCNSFTVLLWIFKLFIDFLIIRRSILNKLFDRLPQLTWIASLNIVTSIIDLSAVAGVCSQIKSQVSNIPKVARVFLSHFSVLSKRTTI